VKEKEVLKRIKSELAKAGTALVVCHIDPDADTVGSMIALFLMLKELEIAATMFSPDPVPKVYGFLPCIRSVKRSLPKGSHFDLCITVDAADERRVGSGFDLDHVADKVINIDHHPDNSKYGDINYVMNVSSAAELVYRLLRYLKAGLSREIADCLYTAIITDTGNFRYENTDVSTFNIAADLVLSGASPHKIASLIYDTKSVSFLKLLSLSLQGAKTAMGSKIIWSTVTKKMIKDSHAKAEDVTGIVDHLRAIDGALIAVLFREEDNGIIKVNLRSKGSANVGLVARALNGGGHNKASGATFKCSLKEAIRRVLNAAERHLK
jgi:phosphoesterase RecJ-like protein